MMDFIYVFIFTGVIVYGCPDNMRMYTEKGERPILKFTMVPDKSKDFITYTVTRYDKQPCMLINYEYGQAQGSPILQNGCTMALTADLSKGILDVKLGAVADGDQGMYQLSTNIVGLKITKCYTLYILGIPTAPTISASGSLYVGTSLTLTCGSTSTTKPSNHSLTMGYSWTWGGSTVTQNERFSFDTSLKRQLTLTSLVRNDDKKVIGCTAKEESGHTSPSQVYTITITYGPENIRFNPTGDSHSYNDGDNFTLVTCLADCHPDCHFSWNKGRTSTSSTAVLELDVVNSGTLGIYICTATHTVPGHALTKTLNVTVVYGPYVVALSPSTVSYTKNEGDALASINCSADCFPACNIFWRRTSEVSAVVSNNAYLSMAKLNRTERGTYNCEATNPDTLTKNTSQEVTVNVRYGPDVVTLNVPNIHTLTEGDAANNINCSADCWPGCVFTWTNLTDNQPMSSSAVLVFKTANRYAAGGYKCLARNSAYQFSETAEQLFNLHVQYAPDVIISQSNTLLDENTPLDIVCKASGVPAVYNYTGFVQRVGDVVVPNSHTSLGVTNSISVNITSLQLQDTGIYTCYVHNGIIGLNKQLIQSASQRIEVSASPQFFLDETVFAGETSGNITIAIPFVTVPEYTTYKVLRHDEKPVSTNGKYTLHMRNASVYPAFYGQRVTLSGHVLQINISDLSKNDFGIYKIQITNAMNTANVSIDIKAASKPSPPTELNLNTMDNTVNFEWRKGFNGGYEQSFVVQTSHNSDVSWTNKSTIKESESKYLKENGKFQVHLTNLVPGIYSARLLAFNFIGAADPVEFKEQFKIKDEEKQTSSSWGLIGGVAGGGLGVTVLAVVAVFIFFKYRRTQKEHGDNNRLTDGQKLTNISRRSGHEDASIPDEVENPMYVSGDDVDIPKVTTADIYATPDKKKPKQNTGAGDIYAIVDKTKKNQDINENGDNVQIKKGRNAARDNSKKNRGNNDGLVYADLVFANPPKGQKKPVIHGIDDMTEYAEVDLTQRADPLSDSDGERAKK